MQLSMFNSFFCLVNEKQNRLKCVLYIFYFKDFINQSKTLITGRMFNADSISAKRVISHVGLCCLQSGSKVTSTNNIHRVFLASNQHTNSINQHGRKTRKHSLLQSEKLVYAKHNKIADSQN